MRPSPFQAEIPEHLVEYHGDDTVETADEAADYFARIKDKFGKTAE